MFGAAERRQFIEQIDPSRSTPFRRSVAACSAARTDVFFSSPRAPGLSYERRSATWL